MPDDRLTTAASWSGLDENPLRLRSGIGVGKAADLLSLGVHQPADTVLWWVAINKRAVLVPHQSTMASQRAFEGLRWGISVTPFLVRKMVKSLFRSTCQVAGKTLPSLSTEISPEAGFQ